jgi:hypothetical protein
VLPLAYGGESVKHSTHLRTLPSTPSNITHLSNQNKLISKPILNDLKIKTQETITVKQIETISIFDMKLQLSQPELRLAPAQLSQTYIQFISQQTFSSSAGS